MLKGKLTVYQVDQCGYYTHGAETRTCGGLVRTLGHICKWLADDQPTIEKTCAYEGDDQDTSLPIFCFDAAALGSNDFLITTWNQTPSDNGTVSAVSRGGIAGQSGILTRNFPKTSIPGFGTHFWFLADKKRLVTVRFESQPLNGHHGLNLYMRGYLARLSPHVRFGDASNEDNVFKRNIIGYAIKEDSRTAESGLKPRFKSSLLRRDSEISYIKKNRAKIVRVIRKGRPTVGGAATKTLLDQVLTYVGASPNNRTLPDQSFSFEIAYTPTESELNEIISRYAPDADHESWDDIGFDFKGESTRRWLSNSTLKLEIELPDDIRAGDGSIDVRMLLEALQPFRAQVSV